MKVRPFERSTLWRSAFSKRRNDPDERDREALAQAYHQLRDRAGDLVSGIHTALPHLTVHDLTHADTLWDVASEICGPKFEINPLAGFILGASFLLHDAGMALAAYPEGVKSLEDSAEWRDAVVSAWKKSGVDEPSDDQRVHPGEDIRDEATFHVLRSRHARQAKLLVTALWTQPATGRPLALVQNDDLLESYGELIGNISASHHWPASEVGRFFGESTPASAAWPREWEVDGLLLACILRCADACAIDETRAPSFLFALRKPKGVSKRHWAFQNKIYPAKRRDDALVFESKSPFSPSESEDWWLCFDAITIADQELRSCDALLRDRQRWTLAARRVVGANDAELLSQKIKSSGWRPVNAQPRISDPQSIIEKLGGRRLYGDDPMAPVRELIQNSVDAIRARRFLDAFFRPSFENKYPGHILVQIEKVQGTDDYWICVEDNGIGMPERVMTGSLLDFGISFWSSSTAAELYPGLPSEKGFRPIGKFGIGFFSIFMYSDTAVVMSREFRGAKDSWGVLRFSEGVRGRGNLSIESTPDEIVGADVNTRIKMLVSKEFLFSLAKVDNWRENEDVAELLSAKLVSKLRRLVLPLDVCVSLSAFGGKVVSLNNPLFYRSERAVIFSTVIEVIRQEHDWHHVSPSQEELLVPLHSAEDDEFFGYCGLNISGSLYGPLKSIGGLVDEPAMSRDPIWGVVECDVTSANRQPDKLLAPKHVILDWARKQIDLILKLNLSNSERENAATFLGTIVNDIRQIFFVITSEGGMTLQKLIERIDAKGSVVFPCSSYAHSEMEGIYSSRPRIGQESMRLEDIAFERFTVWSYMDYEKSFRNPARADEWSTIWAVIINTLRETKRAFTVDHLKNQRIGTYTGVESAYHKVFPGDVVESDVMVISLDQTIRQVVGE
jgi:hypothetical protein